MASDFSPRDLDNTPAINIKGYFRHLFDRAANMRNMIVTGGFGVLGRALGRAAVARDWHVALVDIAPEAPAELGSEPGITLYAGVDLLAEQATRTLFAEIEQRHGTIDALANIAGGFEWVMTEQTDAGIWRRMYEMNVLTAVSASVSAIAGLTRSKGSIVNIGANAALKAGAGMGAYTAAKAGVHRLTEGLAEELRPAGVRVNAVLPSIIDTPTNRLSMPDADFTAWLSPLEVAKVILFLVSSEATAVNGVLLPLTK
jgi:NAD(P)-dependent dehydrogenase (short-subunit alcohol dehydrogenase family)